MEAITYSCTRRWGEKQYADYGSYVLSKVNTYNGLQSDQCGKERYFNANENITSTYKIEEFYVLLKYLYKECNEKNNHLYNITILNKQFGNKL